MSSENFKQMMDLYGNIRIFCFIGAIALLIVAMILFHVLNIRHVFSELTGRAARRSHVQGGDEMVSERVAQTAKLADAEFIIEKCIVMIHTDEII